MDWPSSNLSRREFLKRTGWGAAAIGAGALRARMLRADDLPALVERPTTGWITPAQKSIVAHLHSQHVIPNGGIHEDLLESMIEEGVKIVTATTSPGEAWNKLFKPDDVIGFKFNHVGADVLGTTVPMARRLLQSLMKSGEIAPERIMLIEVDSTMREAIETTLSGELGIKVRTRKPVFGFAGPKADFSSGAEQLAAVLNEVTAIINVPFLKTHNIACMTGCLKNLSHALISRPKRYHDNQCAPYVGDIVALPQIRSKVRIHIVNALCAVYDGGPDPKPEQTWEHKGLLMSADPVAADAVGVDILNEKRASLKLKPIGDTEGHIAHVHAAVRNGLGTDDQDYIDLRTPAIG